ncbi:phosphatase PAP2 family protein [Mangrovicella endophytica]|uniref:phosphatase PAP2 family protein n=1 Tax=Mangrovicella endophytica TaxID=2066697 RepID=UPI001FDEA77E|nr:phosphatase PAP2 family protein [Mangrovicella endophytica]
MPENTSQPRTGLLRSVFRWTSGELELVIALFVAASGLWIFGSIAEEVFEGSAEKLDRTLLLLFRDPANLADPIGPPWFEEMARDVTALGSFAVLALVLLIVLGYLLIRRQGGAALFLILAIAGGQVLSTILKTLFARARPDLVPHSTTVFTASFPSGHAMLSAVTYLTIGTLLMRVEGERRVKIFAMSVAIALTLLVGISRVYLGVHWPTDVLAGWCIGAAWAMVCWALALWLQRRRAIEPPK